MIKTKSSGAEVYPTAYQPMQIFDSPVVLAAVFLASCFLLFMTRKYQRTVTAALVFTAVVLCATIIGAVMGGAANP